MPGVNPPIPAARAILVKFVTRARLTTMEAVMDNGDQSTTVDTHLPPSTGTFSDDLSSVTLVVTNEANFALITNVTVGTFIVASTSEDIDLGDAGDRMTVRAMTINGTSYVKPGTYTTSDWNGFATPSNVSGDGEIFLYMDSGTVFRFR